MKQHHKILLNNCNGNEIIRYLCMYIYIYTPSTAIPSWTWTQQIRATTDRWRKHAVKNRQNSLDHRAWAKITLPVLSSSGHDDFRRTRKMIEIRGSSSPASRSLSSFEGLKCPCRVYVPSNCFPGRVRAGGRGPRDTPFHERWLCSSVGA